MSALTLKKKRCMLFIPLDFETIKIDALVDSGAYINVIIERDANKIQKEANTAIAGKAPPPQLERPCDIHNEVQNRRLHV